MKFKKIKSYMVVVPDVSGFDHHITFFSNIERALIFKRESSYVCSIFEVEKIVDIVEDEDESNS